MLAEKKLACNHEFMDVYLNIFLNIFYVLSFFYILMLMLSQVKIKVTE